MPIPPGFDPAAFFRMYTQKPFINELKVDQRTYYWLKSLKLGDVKAAPVRQEVDQSGSREAVQGDPEVSETRARRGIGRVGERV